MHISFEHYDKTFNVCLHSSKEKEPFLVIKGCRMVDGSKGRFIGFPSWKNKEEKWISHVYASRPFMDAIVAAYEESEKRPAPKLSRDDEIPFD